MGIAIAVTAATAISTGASKVSANNQAINAQNTASHQDEMQQAAIAEQKKKDQDDKTLADAQALQNQQLQSLKGLTANQGRAGTILTGPLGQPGSAIGSTTAGGASQPPKTLLGQ